jgi:PncC family amidohydrolase
VVGLLGERGYTVSTAESCTGGWVAAALTSVPGASEVFWGGVVAYDDAAKTQELEVQASTLERYGAVSEEVVQEMARGIRHGEAGGHSLDRVGRGARSCARVSLSGRPSGGPAAFRESGA